MSLNIECNKHAQSLVMIISAVRHHRLEYGEKGNQLVAAALLRENSTCWKTRQNWKSAYVVDEESYDPNYKWKGIPEVDLDWRKRGEPEHLVIPLNSKKKWEIYTDGSRDKEKHMAGV